MTDAARAGSCISGGGGVLARKPKPDCRKKVSERLPAARIYARWSGVAFSIIAW